MAGVLAFLTGAVVLASMNFAIRANGKATVCAFPARWVAPVVLACDIAVFCGMVVGLGMLLFAWTPPLDPIYRRVPATLFVGGVLALLFGALHGAVLGSLELLSRRTKSRMGVQLPVGDNPLWDRELDL